MLRRVDLPDFVDTRRMHCRLGRSADTASRLVVELPFHLPPQRRPTPGPGIVPIVTDADGRRLIRFAVPIGPDFTVDEVAVEVDSAARQVSCSALRSRPLARGRTDRFSADTSLDKHSNTCRCYLFAVTNSGLLLDFAW